MGHSTAGGALRATERQRAKPHGQTQHAHRYPSGGTVLKGALVLGGIGATVSAGLALRRSLWPAETKSPQGAPGVGNTTQQQPPIAPEFVPLARSQSPVDYRAIVASNNDEAVELTKAQSELLLKLETKPNGESDPKSVSSSVSNEYATLSRDSSGPNVFRWRHLAPEATLRRPMPGQVIICLGGKCVVVSSQRATSIITETFPVYKGLTKVGDKVPSAECAAMALALYERRLENPDERRAEAISDSNGGWLGTPATCILNRGDLTMHCRYNKLQDGTEEMQEIRVTDLVRLLQTRQTAAIDEGLSDRVPPVTLKAVDLAGQCSHEAQNYRAIVAASERTKSTATALTDLQKEGLYHLLANEDEGEIVGEHASLSRLNETNALPGDRDSFLWRPTGHEATLCKPIAGHIIVCLDGECTVMNSQEALKCIIDAGTIRPVCAAIAVALYTKLVDSSGIGGVATAFSDHSGSWLELPATCTRKRHTGFQCTCFLADGRSEVTEILSEHLIKYKPPAGNEESQFVTETPGPSTQVSSSSAGQEMSAGTAWFTDLFGFLDTNENRDERKFAGHKAKFTYDAGRGVLSLVNSPHAQGASWQAGTFTTPSLQELRTEAAQIQKKAASTVTYVSGDIAILHGRREYAGAVFQAASQFNCLEFDDKDNTPELGVAAWYHDHTQGPACAISCAPGTIVRTYFAHEGKRAQTQNDQINTLDDVNQYLRQKANASELLVDVKNGYTNSDSPRLNTLKTTIQNFTEAERNEAMGLLKIGVQKDTQVTCTKTQTMGGAPYAPWLKVDENHPLIVTQVYASALAVSNLYAKGTPDEWEPLARLVLEAAYEATLYAAVAHKKGEERQKVVLTALGGGVFGNKPAWIADAVVKAIAKFKNAGLDIVINEWVEGNLKEIRQALLNNEDTKGLVSGRSSFGPRASRVARSARHVVMYTE